MYFHLNSFLEIASMDDTEDMFSFAHRHGFTMGENEPSQRDEADKEAERNAIQELRSSHIGALDRFFEEILNEEEFEALSNEELEMRQERIRRHFRDMENAHILYKQVCMLASDEIYVDLEQRFMSVMATIARRRKELTSTEQNRYEQNCPLEGPANANSTMFAGLPQVIRVETARAPEIGTFNGDSADWPAFRDLFVAEVHSKELDPVTKLLYLQKACVDKAAETLGPWQPTADNYQSAWQTMINSYNDEYHVVHGILGRMYALERSPRESYGALRKVLDAINGATRQLETISDQSVLWDQMWIHIGKQRLPGTTLDAWEQNRNRHGADRLPTLDEFKRFLSSKAKGRREFEHEPDCGKQGARDQRQRNDSSGNRYKPYQKDGNRDRSYAQNGSNARNDSTEICAVPNCGQRHPVWRCETFLKMPLLDRKDVVFKKRLCRCCLGSGHMASQCTRQSCSKCPGTTFKHHFRLCSKTTDGANGNQFAKRAVEPTKQ